MDRRSFTLGLATAATTAILFEARPASAQDVLTPEQFGARGDGRTDDSEAFARLGDAVSRAGGGRVVLRRTTYIVGGDGPLVRGRLYTTKLLEVVGCSRPVDIEGNGATLRCPSGQRFGAFATASGSPAGAEIRTPYRQMILVRECTGSVRITGLELDGNAGNHVVGAAHGDAGWQIPCTGLHLSNNPGAEIVRDIHTHDHGLDGLYIDGVDADTPDAIRSIDLVRSDRNARQGLSVVGGRGYRISNSDFTRTGRGKLASAPAAGIDIEAEHGKRIRNIAFRNCRCVDNHGVGMVADTGDSADVSFDGCTFVGVTQWSVWPRKPRYSFSNCTFAGSLVHVFASADPAQATRFVRCTFTDDPALSPAGRLSLYNGYCAYLRESPNVLFDSCTFRMDRDGRLPSTIGAIYVDCTMAQRDARDGSPCGTYRGSNRITGAVRLAPSIVEGRLVVNGRSVAGRL